MSAGKGSAPRNCFSKQYRENYDRIFGKSRDEGRGSRASKSKPNSLQPSIRTVEPHPHD